MVFSSVPLYLDPPNWQQHQNHHQQQQQQQQQQLQGNNGTGNHHEINQQGLNIPALPPAVQQVGVGGGGQGRPNSMAERARLAKIPPPEAPLKCPRCESTNTKFCYFNNYSLTQPRHFCKTCRRYWTRGGALRNVPVGGGCRRNKRSSGGTSAKSSSSATTTSSSAAATKSLSSSLSSGVGPAGFMASLQSIAHLGMGGLGLTFPPGPTALHSSNPGGGGGLLDQLDHYGGSINASSNISALLNHHHHHQVSSFPNFLGGFEIPSANSFQNVVVGGDADDDDQVSGKGMTSSLTNMNGIMGGGVKMEGSEKGLLMGMNSTTSSVQMNVTSSMTTMNNNNNGQFWGATAGGGDTGSTSLWTTAAASHLAGLNSSSTTTTTHLL